MGVVAVADAGALVRVLPDPDSHWSFQVVFRREEVPRSEKRFGRPTLHVHVHVSLSHGAKRY
ncbi:hypothetical protein GCM10009006_20840 [Haloarcula argentinensis]|uniref:Uncharacterized protein n=1 Tax=Haloarcula argentinensis TaxID=43776 RepID=A0A830FHY9_HALAR|nr:hypothetical protein GCM10009006_20840 [Haloarcula argentinensis]